MSKANVLARPEVTFRWMIQRDLPAVLRLADQVPLPSWSAAEFQEAFRSIDTVARVAEIGDQMAGVLIYRITQEPDLIDPESLSRYLGPRTRTAGQAVRPVQMELLYLVVAPEFRRQGVGRALLQMLERRLQQSGGSVRVVVPETCLACQLLLRDQGFRATRLLRGHFDDEDGYVMERRG